MARYRCVEQNLELIRRSGAWNPRIQRILKAAPLVVFFLLLNARSARSASCSFNPAPDPTVDGSPTSLRHAIQAANASGQDCLITLAKGTYTITIKNTNGHENDAAQGDLDIGDSGHTVTIQGQGAASSIVNGNKIDRVFDVLSGADAVFQNLTIEGGIAQDDGTSGALPGTTAALGGGILVQGTGQASLEGVTLKGNLALGGTVRREGVSSAPGGLAPALEELVNRQLAAVCILLPGPLICRVPRFQGMLRAEVPEGMVATPVAPPVYWAAQADREERELAADSISLRAPSYRRPQCPGTARPEEQAVTVGLIVRVSRGRVGARETGMGVACSLGAAL